MSHLLGNLGGQYPKTIFSVIFGPFTTNGETTFLKFQKKFFFHYILVVIFPADCKRRVGMLKIEISCKVSGVSLCVFSKG